MPSNSEVDEARDGGNGLETLFNRPVGYSKNPLVDSFGFGSGGGDFGEVDEVAWNKVDDMDQKLCGVDSVKSCRWPGFPLEKLPSEIVVNVANELSQFDCLSLMRTSKCMYLMVVPRLYQHIIVDKNYSQFSKEYDYRYLYFDEEFGCYETCSCSYIKSPYTFKRFLTNYCTLAEEYGHRLESFDGGDLVGIDFPHINRFECIELPDSLNTYDYEFSNILNRFFSRLVKLQELVWLSDNFRLEYLSELPNNQSISTLVLNIKFSNYLNELELPSHSFTANSQAADKTTANSHQGKSKFLNFPNLRNFQIRPFQNSKRLTRIINNMLMSFDPDSINRHLRVLKIARFDKDTSVLVPPYHDLVTFDEHHTLRDLDLGTIPALFHDSKLTMLENLTVLLLNNCLVTPADGTLMAKSVNLGNLYSLELKNISEIQRVGMARRSRGELLNQLEPSFILRLAPHLNKLRHLLIDFRECYADSVPEFLNTIPSGTIQSLDITVRFNSSKLNSFGNDINGLYSEYASALNSNNKRSLLLRLSIEIKEENTFCDLNLPLPLTMFYDAIVACSRLKYLRINPSDATDQNKMPDLIRNLAHLEMLDVFGSQAGGAPHFGLGMVHPTIFDEWFKVQHVAILYLKRNPNLKYIRINRCIFECFSTSNTVNPRDGIDRWFDSFVRVGAKIDV